MKRTAAYTVLRSGSAFLAIDSLYETELVTGSDAGQVIQSAIDALPAEGGRIHIQAGVYVVRTPISWRDKYVCLEGEGHAVQYTDWGTVLKQDFSGTLINISYSEPNRSGFEIRSLKLEGDRRNFTGSGIEVRNAKGWLIEDVVIRYFDGNALRVVDCGWHKLINVFCGGSQNDNLVYYSRAVDWKWFGVAACTVTRGQQQHDAVYLERSSGEIHGGHFEAGEKHGRHGLVLDRCFQLSVVEAKIYKAGQAGVYVDRAWGSIKLIGLTIWKTRTGIHINNSKRVTVSACTVEAKGDARPEYGLRETGRSDYNIVTGCSFWDATVSDISAVGANTHVNMCWNGETWIP